MSLSTDGWDYVYNMTLEAVNETLKSKFGADLKAKEAFKATIAKEFADGFTGGIISKMFHRGEKYKLPLPTATIKSYENKVYKTKIGTARKNS